MSSNNNPGTGNFRGRGKWFRQGRGNPRGSRGFYFNNKSKRNDSSQNEKTKHNVPTENIQPTSSKAKPTQISIDTFYEHVPSRYKAWKIYHPMEEYNTASPTVNKIKAVEMFFKRNYKFFNTVEIEDKRYFHIDLKYLTNNDKEFLKEWSDFQNDLNNNPDYTLNCLSLSMHQFILDELEKHVSKNGGKVSDITLPIIRARVLNHEPVLQLKDLASNSYGKLVSIKGTVIRVGNIKLLCTWLAFSCNKCSKIQCVQQPEGSYTLPTSCSAQGCLCRTFTPLCSSNFTQTVNWQTVKIQEIISDDQLDGGRVPRTVECELVEELVDSCLPGDVVTITGIVKIRCNEEGYNKKSKSPSIFNIYIEGKSVNNNKNHLATGGSIKQTIDIEFNTDDYYNIKELHSQSGLFKLAVNSLCPAIYGHEMVKAGLLLGLVGGSLDGSSRGDSHILIVGDPGLGKSQMLQACAAIAPRGVYVCGNTSSSCGLTVTLTREAGGNYALEAGALVLADQGCCCIDEFDKMSNQHQALLEAMEQQVISISKAGVICTLPARTSILAAANPVCGHYNRAKTVAENLRLGSALLSRFDLVFILQDRPNEHLDILLSEHVIALYSGLKRTSDFGSEAGSSVCNETIQSFELPLSERLKLDPGENIDLISPSLLRKYIAYAKKYVPNPYLSSGAVNILQTFYLELRKQHHTLDATPITTRQLESLIRLTQARAKLELREEATALDAIEVVELMRWSMVDTFSDDFGDLDFRRSQHGSGMSTKNKAKQFINVLQKIADSRGQSLFSVSDMKEIANKSKIVISDFFAFVCSLNDQGFLLKKGKNLYQLMSVGY
ncbi:DNA helicase MCM8-like [Lycorma delicatula]|uniref:DNA helicase MCM8-like n=1 Tax=Lycorma delicatula TaxID=130591 RepID=UPI003F517261